MKPLNKFRLLVIDDSIAIHQDFVKILTSVDIDTENDFEKLDDEIFGKSSPSLIDWPKFVIDRATQGNEGIALIKKALDEKNPYSVVFVDIRMPPGLDGIQTIQNILPLDHNIQIVICTAYSDYTWEETIEALGMRDNILILKKPFDNSVVRQLASALTQKWELLRKANEHTSFLENTLEFQATHDSLTNLPNRLLLYDRIRHDIAVAARSKSKLAFLYIDINRFKLINDSLGIKTGDLLLIEVARRLKSVLRGSDTLSRFCGDEFIVIISDVQNQASILTVANKLFSILKSSFEIAHNSLNITINIGVSVFPDDGNSIDELLRNAHLAMLKGKTEGCQIDFYMKNMSYDSMEALQWEIDIRKAIENKEFFLTYQPIYNSNIGKIIGAEVLLRWNHPSKGVLLPIDFLPQTEISGLIVEIGKWTLLTACKTYKSWLERGFNPEFIAVNVATPQLRQSHFVNTVNNILNETGLNPKHLVLEATENVVFSSIEIQDVIERIRRLGVKIALDDFGTGNSSLSYLRSNYVDTLKIDKSFIHHIESNEKDEIIIKSIIALALSLNINVIAEGVETKNQLEFLQKEHCFNVQGFYFSKPLIASEFEKMLRK